ncbi:hypothetical protein ACFOZY_02150 [Chungangia koreensis]|uniref:Hook-length control protein FliK n=1 Tax=Chungangia koreensis TaxID=752657 RepID=A0ABV8X1R1_9LACT
MNMGHFPGISPVRPIQQPQPLVLKQGQVFHGTVQQLFPEQTAEVAVGGHRLVAKMEVPLKAGDSHYFVVTSTTPEIQLKIAGDPVSQHPTDMKQIGLLAQALGLPNTKEMNTLLSMIVSKQIPMTNEQLLMAESWLKSLPPEQLSSALLALEKMVSLKVPFTSQAFQSVLGGLDKSGLLSLIGNLSNQLHQEQQLPLSDRQRLMNTLGNIAEPIRTQTAVSLLATSALNLTLSGEAAVFNTLKQSHILPTTATMSNWSVEVLSTSGKLPDESLGKMLKQILLSEPKNSSQYIRQYNQTIESLNLPENLKIADQSVSSTMIKELHQNLVKALSGPELQQNETVMKHLLSLFGMDEQADPGLPKLNNLLQAFQDADDFKMRQLLQQAMQNTENTIDGKVFETVIKNVLKTMGLGYEHSLNGKTFDPSVIDQLKPQLLSLIQHPATSAQLKESAEHIIYRLNGAQLLSAESGHQQQIVMQIPLQFFGKKMDATLNWTGRMKEDGKIDSEYVRVLFYLQLSFLKETVVDMAVQNRVVTINVYNEAEGLMRAAEPFREALKEGLAAADYRLSGLTIKTFAEQSTTVKKKPSDPVKGVDIRI